MKAVILISSIFYLLGLKIGHKAELFRKNNSHILVDTSKADRPVNDEKNFYLKTESKNDKKVDPDSLSNKGSLGKIVPCVRD